ncbi:glycosyltransferase family 4 protein [Nocardioides panacis]|uniref:Glycosyltransferase family 4 protein n=1 Tax=Nocardioides panacis TaxID=2849501 RepID=A0A975T1W7_9ACTN|nr:glycosyltransferase family 4 protein [Nocardioides panacis]QWZ09369.1 glycosyltransferase family 4 protein [Nocardioides panacis]
MKVGIVCPYSLDVPGGVQNHVKDLAEALIALGHDVSVLAPSESDGLPPYVVPAGRAVAVPYNGSVARMSFGPVVAARTRRWLHDGAFDVLHLHEPATPSLSLLALWQAECPVVATYHSSNDRSRALSASAAILRPSLEKISARIAVSEYSRGTQVSHVGGEPVVIPNGLYVDRFAHAEPREEWRGSQGTVAFVGRFGEPRKGFPLLSRAFARLAAERPGLRLLVVGGGDVDEARALLPEAVRDQVTFLGRASDEDKAAALRTADVYVAPNTGGESFGIILVEAMAAGATVLASDIPAFRRVVEDTAGVLFASGDVDDLAAGLAALLDDPARRAALDAAARTAVRRYDWSSVAGQILRVYETVVAGGV